ncbi:MAG: hypothetical protein RMX97_25660 [Nostoc sp. DedQUE11]|nr:hypothetical protein [Nostoc sp. DedQUE11]
MTTVGELFLHIAINDKPIVFKEEPSDHTTIQVRRTHRLIAHNLDDYLANFCGNP